MTDIILMLVVTILFIVFVYFVKLFLKALLHLVGKLFKLTFLGIICSLPFYHFYNEPKQAYSQNIEQLSEIKQSEVVQPISLMDQ